MSLIFRILIAVSILLAYGCSTANFTSTKGFELHISDAFYRAQTCNRLHLMRDEMNESPAMATLKHLGLDVYGVLPNEVFISAAERNWKGINGEIVRRC